MASLDPNGFADHGEAGAAFLDRRYMAFRPPMLLRAIEMFGHERLGLPQGTLLDVECAPEGQTLSVSIRTSAGTATYGIDAQKMAAVLIGFCIGSRIPLARAAAKAITVLDDSLVMETLVSMRAPPPYLRTR